MTESSIANTAQYEYWNNVAGPRWVGLDGFVERRVRAVNHLLLARSAVMPRESVLEIGCGTGAATVPFAEVVGQRGRVSASIYPSRCWQVLASASQQAGSATSRC